MQAGEEQSRLLIQLEERLIARDVREGFRLLDQALALGQMPNPGDAKAAPFLLCLAQWVDLGYRDLAFLNLHLANFPRRLRSRLSALDYIKLRLAEAFVCLATEDLERSITLLDAILCVGHELLPPELIFLANFWKGRAHRKKGDYELARLHLGVARQTAEESNASRLVAVTRIHESWLMFQRGERKLALELLDQAEEELRDTGHALSLGNIESARGRFVRRSGDYPAALEHFERAIRIYKGHYSKHPNLARALVNAAYVKRLMALDMQAKLKGANVKGAAHAAYLNVAREALELLQQAAEIYASHHHQGGTGSVLVNAGHLFLESGAIDEASNEADKAFALGRDKHDDILMARARVLGAAAELARAEEELGNPAEIDRSAERAVHYADEAIELAQHTQNRRLLAEAFLVRGSIATADIFRDWNLAKDFTAKAAVLLTEDDRDHLYKELHRLRTKILRSIGIDPALRLWSQGDLGTKSFQQVQEEFAELVIPRVWINCGRNVTLVAQQLSISPKKVRRILRNTGHTTGGGIHTTHPRRP
jgi:tetratricopeptide (TPR) repeat protein